MGEATAEFVVHTNTEIAKTPQIGFKEKAEALVNPELRTIRNKISETERNGLDKDAGDTVLSILNSTRKVIELCTNHPRLAADFSKRFKIEDGVVSRVSDIGFVVAKDPVTMATNFSEISADPLLNKADSAKWMIETSLVNLATWIGLAAESNPAILREINDDLDIERFGLSAEVAIKNDREKITISADGKIPETLFSGRMRSVSKEIEEKFGKDVVNQIYIYGGTSRSLVIGEDPFDNRGGDIDYFVASEVSEETRNGINEIVSKYGIGKPDDLTDPVYPFRKNMEREGFVDIFEAIRKDPTFSIDKIAINISTGEIFDPHGGLADLKNGVLRIVGEDYEKKFKSTDWQNSKEAMILAFRGARLGAQYAMEVDSGTENFFKPLMERNKFKNRFGLALHGIEELPFFSAVGKTYLNMLEKTSHAVLIPKYLEKFGLLDQVSGAINFLNSSAKIAWGDELRKIDDLVWERNYRQLVEKSVHSHSSEGQDIRFSGKKYEEKTGPMKFVSTTLGVSRMLSYLFAGI